MDYTRETTFTEDCIIELFASEENQCFFWSIRYKEDLDTLIYSKGLYRNREIALGKAYKIAFYVDNRVEAKKKELNTLTNFIQAQKGTIQPCQEYPQTWDICISLPHFQQGKIHYDLVKGWSGTPQNIVEPILIAAFSNSQVSL